MFGGKKLKDLTEEDIRNYAASLVSATSMHGGLEADEPERPDPSAEVAQRQQLAQAIAQNAKDGDASGYTDAPDREAPPEAPVAALPEPELSAEEQARLQVLAELDRSQMPAVKKDGNIQKTIEHYTFADSQSSATITVEADKDLYEGAAEHVKEEQIEVLSKDKELVVILHGVPTTKAANTYADWTLRLAPLCHSVRKNVMETQEGQDLREANEEKAPRLEKIRSDLTGRDANNILTCTKT
ncbi:unnamed protein product [Cladocopium goreaui]|uniref:JmjC domain-containing protein 8 n=1 Tax=Cladocopium goreaui TaxID=2562237 RepID=A0A9P1C1M1_9DINO|nr:unnamed protein product [Cladocopium goreaui]